MDTNVLIISKESHYDDTNIYQVTPKQDLRLDSWKIWPTVRLSWKKPLVIKSVQAN